MHKRSECKLPMASKETAGWQPSSQRVREMGLLVSEHNSHATRSMLAAKRQGVLFSNTGTEPSTCHTAVCLQPRDRVYCAHTQEPFLPCRHRKEAQVSCQISEQTMNEHIIMPFTLHSTCVVHNLRASGQPHPTLQTCTQDTQQDLAMHGQTEAEQTHGSFPVSDCV